MKAWFTDALTMGGCFGIASGVLLRDGIGEAVMDGVVFGIALASVTAWRRWPSLGRRRFAKTS